jgi:hypothetical protein
MKTTKLTCNVCRHVEEIEAEAYAPNPPKVGWYHVVVSELRPPPPPPKDPTSGMAEALGAMLDEQDAPPAARKFLKTMTEQASSMPSYEPPPMPTSLAADLCPTCGPKLLSGVLPHCTSERSTSTIGFR